MKKTDYQVLVEFGHSPEKALEISINAKRGEEFEIRWIQYAKEKMEIKDDDDPR